LPTKPQVFVALPLATGNSPCCSIDGKVIAEQVVPLLKQLATEKGLPTIDLQTPTLGHPEYFGDGVHPTDAAYALVAKWMHDGLLVDRVGGGQAGAGGAGAGGAGAGGDVSSAGAADRAGSGGGAGLANGGAPSSPSAGNGAANLAGAGTSAAGAPSSAGRPNGGGSGSNLATAGSSSRPARSDSSGCTVADPGSGASWFTRLGWVGAGWLVSGRRRARG